MIVTSNDVKNGLYEREKYLKEQILRIVQDPVRSNDTLVALAQQLVDTQNMYRSIPAGKKFKLVEVTENAHSTD